MSIFCARRFLREAISVRDGFLREAGDGRSRTRPSAGGSRVVVPQRVVPQRVVTMRVRVAEVDPAHLVSRSRRVLRSRPGVGSGHRGKRQRGHRDQEAGFRKGEAPAPDDAGRRDASQAAFEGARALERGAFRRARLIALGEEAAACEADFNAGARPRAPGAARAPRCRRSRSQRRRRFLPRHARRRGIRRRRGRKSGPLFLRRAARSGTRAGA